MVLKKLLPVSLLALLPIIALTGCQSHGRDSSPNYHINSMERVDEGAGNQKDEKIRRMERDIYKDK